VVAASAPPAGAGDSSSSSSSSSGGGSGGSGGDLGRLTAAEPIDRLRYQGLLIFDNLDSTRTGQLSAAQLQQFLTMSARKVRAQGVHAVG
jgi:hypothetical protein